MGKFEPTPKNKMMLKVKVILFCCLLLLLNLVHAEDFYSLLKISKNASTKDIRKVFKKLAIIMHPDKKQGDPQAHEKFIRINRAYEVLKDDTLRKKYDTYGEEGLKDDFNRGRHYESWQWYQDNFGIYDDDVEIITLSKTDFEGSVEGTDDIWFINYYSPQCSHCHDLAPDWRTLAKELEGVIRIGAVNCADEWSLCRMQGIRSYPTLVMYPQREHYFGERSVRPLVDYAMKHVKHNHIELYSANYHDVINYESDVPWLVTFCGEGGDCLERTTCLKLANMLEQQVHIVHVDCYTNADICDNLGKQYGTYFYKSGQIESGRGMEITSLNAQEILNIVLSELPEMSVITESFLQAIIDSKSTGQKEDWLLQFNEGEDSGNLDLRKLPAMLPDFNLGRVNCHSLSVLCSKLHVTKFPKFILFKANGGHESFYGRLTAHDIVAFATDSATSTLENLGPSDFPNRVILSRDPWFVDFFDPGCPPCMKLLPEFKKAAREFGYVSFGTVDCTVHNQLCRNYNIRSYPTTIFYNESKPIQYKGHSHAGSMIEFLQDTMNPPVIILDRESFQDHVKTKDDDEIWVVDFFAPWCGPCMQLAPEWRKLAKMLKGTKKVFVAQVDCQQYSDLCQQEHVQSYPTMRLYPTQSSISDYYHIFNGWHRDASSLRAWVYEYLPSKVTTLSRNSFREKVLKSAEPWVVDFYAPWCGHCQTFKPEFERVAETLEGVARAGTVDCTQNEHLCTEANIHGYPTIRFYQGAQGHQQHPSGWDINSQDGDTIIDFIHKNRRRKAKDEL